MRYVFLFAALSLPLLGQDYFPLQVGNQWLYRQVAGLGKGTFVTEIAGTQDVNGQTYFDVRNLFGKNWLARMNDAGQLVALGDDRKSETLLADFGAADGYKSGFDDCAGQARVTSRNARAMVVQGEIDGALRVDYGASPRCADAGLTSETYYPYVGLVERTETSFAGPVTWRLIYSRTGGVTVLAQSENSFTLSLDKASYKGGDLLARLTLRNSGLSPLKLSFNSGQRYDLTIKNAAGNVVYQASRGIFYSQALGEIEVTGEKNWVVTVPLNLPAGAYTAEGWLTPSTGTQYRSSARFVVE